MRKVLGLAAFSLAMLAVCGARPALAGYRAIMPAHQICQPYSPECASRSWIDRLFRDDDDFDRDMMGNTLRIDEQRRPIVRPAPVPAYMMVSPAPMGGAVALQRQTAPAQYFLMPFGNAGHHFNQ